MRCGCGYLAPSWVWLLLHRVWAHRERPEQAMAYVLAAEPRPGP